MFDDENNLPNYSLFRVKRVVSGCRLKDKCYKRTEVIFMNQRPSNYLNHLNDCVSIESRWRWQLSIPITFITFENIIIWDNGGKGCKVYWNYLPPRPAKRGMYKWWSHCNPPTDINTITNSMKGISMLEIDPIPYKERDERQCR